MKIKRIAVLLLCFVLAASAAFAADYTYGSGERYTAGDIAAIMAKRLGSTEPLPEASGDDVGLGGGSVYISADAFTLGGDYILYPTKVELREGDNAASVLLRALAQNDIYCEYDGSIEEDFYLTAMSATNLTINVEPSLEEWLRPIAGYYEPQSWTGGILSTFDITDMSGWMYTVNGEMPSMAMSDCEVRDGDVISVRFSLAYGMDIGGAAFGGTTKPFIDNVNRDEAVKAIAEGRLDYMECVGILNKSDASQEDIVGLLRVI